MSTITDIREGKKQGRLNLFLDGRFAFSLQTEVVEREGLYVGQGLSSGQVETLTGDDRCLRCYSAALRYLSYRPRSESELREKLRMRSYDSAVIDTTLVRLKEEKLVDDREFAEFWKDNRQAFRPQSRWLTEKELRRKGVSADVIASVVDGTEDEESAYKAAQSRIRTLSGADYATVRRKLGDYLKRRGFSYEIAERTVKRVWQELTPDKDT